jgi:GTP cyclohydrolase IA
MDRNTYQKHVTNLKTLLTDLGEDPAREGLLKTPTRHLDSLDFLMSGYSEDPKAVLQEAVFSEKFQDLVIVRDIEVYSLCEHHMLPFFGRCHVGYIPNGHVVGLSKIPRVVDIYSRRLQVQERLTHQIAEALMTALNPHGVGVIVEAYHLCMMMRGVEKQNSCTMTSCMLGSFQKIETRSEFLSLIRSPARQSGF